MKYYLIGYPLNYSCSPIIHKCFNRNVDYEIKVLKEDELESFILSKEFNGLNVTIPYKEKVMSYLDQIDEAAKNIGAVNTIVNQNGILIGYNTDYYGVKTTFKNNKVNLKDKVVMILGSGGTYKTCKVVCEDLKAKEVIGVSRYKKDGFITYEEAVKRVDVQIIINATPVGTTPNVENSPIKLDTFSSLECVLDMIYNPIKSELLLDAEARKVKIINGLMPLVYQAGKAEELFTNTTFNKYKYVKAYYKMFKNYSSITLIGLPGSGKSYIGKLLAKKMKYRFIDTDSEISKQEKMSIKDIFLTYGEEYFRRKEEELIKKLALKQRIVISTGGGMIENPVIMKYLKYNSKIVHLDREMDDSLFDGRRPKLKTIEDYLSLKDKRMHLYRKYEDLYVKNDKDSDLIVERIIKKL